MSLKYRLIPVLSKSDLLRFWKFVDKTPGHGPEGTCWLWTGGQDRKGYGLFSIGTALMYRVSRVSWKIVNERDPELLHVLHRCDNPPCVNPAHLFLGTDKDNCDDAFRKGRRPITLRITGSSRFAAKLTPDDVKAIRAAPKTVTSLQLAGQYGLHVVNIRRVRRGASYVHDVE